MGDRRDDRSVSPIRLGFLTYRARQSGIGHLELTLVVEVQLLAFRRRCWRALCQRPPIVRDRCLKLRAQLALLNVGFRMMPRFVPRLPPYPETTVTVE
jgi:hypothetical protein